jgi:hypothetical protein
VQLVHKPPKLGYSLREFCSHSKMSREEKPV